jgi:hypothetical protein
MTPAIMLVMAVDVHKQSDSVVVSVQVCYSIVNAPDEVSRSR